MSQRKGQIYSIPTYDAAFKWVLADPTILPSFFHAFVPDLSIENSSPLDDHMSPLQLFQLLRRFVYDPETEEIITALKQAEHLEVHVGNEIGSLNLSPKASKLLQDFIRHFDDMQNAFPMQKFNGTMDFVCRLSSGDYALVEMQIIPQNHWDKRAFAYLSLLFGSQLRKGGDWSKIKKVIGINILGGGISDRKYWQDTPNQYVRHYRIQEQIHEPSRYIDGIELIQYSLANAPQTLDTQEQQDWITFFKRAHTMTEEEVQATIKTPSVLIAFERAKIESLPGEVRKQYEKEDAEYDRYSEHTAETIAKERAEGKEEGRAEGRAEGARSMARKRLLKGSSVEEVAEDTDLSIEEVKSLQKQLI